MTRRVGFSLRRIGTIAGNTFVESLRQKVFNVLLLVALALIASGLFFRQFSFSEQFKFVKDTGLGFMAFFGALIAIVGTAQLLPAEIENRTIYTLLAKPVRRVEFLLGKYLGSLLLLFVSLLLMGLMFGAELLIMESGAIQELRREGTADPALTPEQAIREIQAEARDLDLVKAVILIQVKIALLAAITLLFSTFSTSMVFNVAMGFMAWIAGSLVEPVREVLVNHPFALALLAIVPDLSAFNVADELVQGLTVSWEHTLLVAGYGLGRTVLILGAGYFIFSQREI